jgi:hypothetical protein
MIFFTTILDPEPNLELDPLLFSDPGPLKQMISDPGGSGSCSTTLIVCQPLQTMHLLERTGMTLLLLYFVSLSKVFTSS